MASFVNMLRTCGLIIYLVITVSAVYDNSTGPWIMSMKVVQKNCDAKNCKYYVKVRGGDFFERLSWRLTPYVGVRGGNCDVIHSDYEINERETNSRSADLEIALPIYNGKIYLCTFINGENGPFVGRWLHQGVGYYLEPKNESLEKSIGQM